MHAHLANIQVLLASTHRLNAKIVLVTSTMMVRHRKSANPARTNTTRIRKERLAANSVLPENSFLVLLVLWCALVVGLVILVPLLVLHVLNVLWDCMPKRITRPALDAQLAFGASLPELRQ